MPNIENLIQVYLKRPDLQALYNADGSAKNPKDPKVAGIPTLRDWAVKFGAKEDATLADFAPGAPGTTTTTTGNTAPFDPASYGISQELWGTLSSADKAFVESAAGLLKGQFDAGQTNVSINQDLLNKALTSAQTDPDIIAKYGDSAKTAANDIQFNLGQINANYATQQTQQQLEMAQAKKNLQDQIASGGQAYSGFRKQAENILGAQQANIIQSTKSQLQQNLQTLGSQYEKQFGTGALAGLPPLTVGGETYNPIGNTAAPVVGTEGINKQQDIQNRQAQIYNQERL